MKVEDLMIGDWVNVFDIPKQIEGVRKFRNGDEIVYYDGDNGNFIKAVTPISLTSEILEKNGFTSVEDQYNHKKYFLLGKNEYNCNVYWDGLTILLVEEDYEPTTYAYICDAEYVHELQHALKLCKIEKEIVL